LYEKMNTGYYAYLINTKSQFPLGVNIENGATTIFVADAKNNIAFFTDDNILYIKQINGTANTLGYNMGSTIISLSHDNMLRIIVIGTSSAIQVFPYDNSQLPLKSLYNLTNTWALNYRLYFDPIFYRVIIDFDISKDKTSHKIVDWNFLNKQELPFLVSSLQDYFLIPYTK
jgi:hypothetical protein